VFDRPPNSASDSLPGGEDRVGEKVPSLSGLFWITFDEDEGNRSCGFLLPQPGPHRYAVGGVPPKIDHKNVRRVVSHRIEITAGGLAVTLDTVTRPT
jgi:hypothetical protein